MLEQNQIIRNNFTCYILSDAICLMHISSLIGISLIGINNTKFTVQSNQIKLRKNSIDGKTLSGA